MSNKNLKNIYIRKNQRAQRESGLKFPHISERQWIPVRINKTKSIPIQTIVKIIINNKSIRKFGKQ